MNIFIERIRDPVERQDVEFVESKGTGHPDSICDDVCTACAGALAAYYKKRFRTVLHYNIDKALLVAGAAEPKFKGGQVTAPIRIIIAGRVTDRAGGRVLPVRKVIKDAATAYLRRFNLAKFKVVVDVKSAAANLAVISERKQPVANDTSFGASHYPFSRTERLVLDACSYISSSGFRRMFPAAGQDTKVMGVRTKGKIRLTVAMAFIGRHINDMAGYVANKKRIAAHLKKRFRVPVAINTLDDAKGDARSIYLTVSGLSAEMGDDGQVGRGNRYNGIITPSRPMSIEATSGKNPRHPGRSYQVAALCIAKDISRLKDVKSAEVKLVTDIGSPLEEPDAVSIRVVGNLGKAAAERIVKKNILRAIRD